METRKGAASSSADDLIDRRVVIVRSDTFGERLAAYVRRVDRATNSLFLELASACQVGDRIYPFAVAGPRLMGDDLFTLLASGSLGCGITYIPRDHFDSSKPFDVSWWRGGPADITDVVLE